MSTPSRASCPLPCTRIVRRILVCMFLASFALAAPARCQSTPSLLAGTQLWARLDRTVSSKTAHIGDEVQAVLIKPAKWHGQIVLPAETRLRGTVEAVRASDRPQGIWAKLKLEFTELILPDGRTAQIKASAECSQQFEPGIWPAAVAAGGIVSAGIGAGIGSAWGGKGAGIGAAIGGGAVVLAMILHRPKVWNDVEIRGYKTALLINLDEDLFLTPATPSPKK